MAAFAAMMLTVLALTGAVLLVLVTIIKYLRE